MQRFQNNTKRNILNKSSYNFTSNVSKDAEIKGLNHMFQETSSFLQRSVSADNVVVRSRGFKPSDRHDPTKKNLLENLSSKILHFDMETGERIPMNLQKLLTPATDSNEVRHVKNKKMYASSYFYAPTHPTVEDQVELARRISNSLSDDKNMKSKGQSMYVNRKKRSVKWVHGGNRMDGEEDASILVLKNEVPLKCVMNPCGKVLDIHGIQASGEEVNIESVPSHPEKLFDIVRDLNNQKGRGAEIFAKRRKRSEKWIVDKEQQQTPSTPGYQRTSTYPTKQLDDSSNHLDLSPITPLTPVSPFDDKYFYNPFTMDLKTGNSNSLTIGCTHQSQGYTNSENGVNETTKVEKIYLREAAVGTDAELPLDDCDNFMRNCKQMPTDIENRSRASTKELCNNHCKSIITNSNFDHHSKHNSNSINYHSRPDSNSNHLFRPNSNSNYRSRPNLICHHHSRPNFNFNHHSRPNSDSQSISKSKYDSNPKYRVNSTHHYARPSVVEEDGNVIRNNSRNENQEYLYSDSEESEYTPVPVKQLIQEFEKTCRPVMQYKLICPKAIPVISQNKLPNNDLSRFFETHFISSKYEVCHEIPENERDIFERASLDSCRSNGYISSEDLDNVSLDGSLSLMDFYQFEDRKPVCENEMRSISTRNRTASMSMVDEYFRRKIMNTEDQNYGNTKYIEIETDEKEPSVLAMVGTQDVISDAIKNLRNTPVVDNLVSADYDSSSNAKDGKLTCMAFNSFNQPSAC